MAVDTLFERGGKLANIEPELMDELDKALPASWSRSNPIDIVGDADSQRYIVTLKTLFDSKNIDAILVMMSPSAVASADETAQALMDLIKQDPRAKRFNILTNWSGEMTVNQARLKLSQAGIPTYRTPESAVGAFMHLVEYRRNQKQLMETPSTSEAVDLVSMTAAKQWIAESLANSNDAVHFDTHELTTFFTIFNFACYQLTSLLMPPSRL